MKMRTIRKAAAVAAAIGLTVTGTMAAYGATAAADTSVAYATKSMGDGGTADSVITGHIKVTNISVQVPMTSSFDIDPNKTVAAGGDGGAQMGDQATNYTITNLSTVPLDISITKVTPVTGVELVQTVAALDAKDKNVLFAIREASETVPKLPGGAGGDDAKWLSSGVLATPYKVAATAGKNTIQASGAAGGADSLTMKVYAATKKGWKSGDSFTITPTFTVSLNTTTS